MASPTQDLRDAIRSLRRAPGFTLVAALTLGLGVGANTAMVGLFDALLVRPPAGVLQPREVVRVRSELPALPGRPQTVADELSYVQFSALRTRASGFSALAAFSSTPLGVGEGEAARNEPVILASGEYFPLLGVRAALGRMIQPDDDREGAANPVAVLSYDYWRRAYGGDPSVLGEPIRVAGRSLTIVGVAPKHFVGTELGATALWVPLSLAGSIGYDDVMMRSPFVAWLNVVGRLKPGVTRQQAIGTAQAALLAAEDERASAAPLRMGGGATPGAARVEMRVTRGGGAPAGATVDAPPPPRVVLARLAGAGLAPGGRGTPAGGTGGSPVQGWYLAITAAVLLIACANVANLLLARGAYRAHELAVRLSLGATSRRVARQLLTESAVLAALGALVGLVVAVGVWRLIPLLIVTPPLPPLLDARVLLVTAALAAVTVALFGIAPLFGLRRHDLRGMMGAAAPSVAPRSRGRSALVIVQFAISVVLLIGAGLFMRSFRNVQRMDVGFDRDHLLVVTADTRGPGWTPERAAGFWEEAGERVRRVPGVREVAAGVSVPYLMRIVMPFRSEDERSLAPAEIEPAQADFVGPGFFETMGIAIEAGRPFTDQDGRGSTPVAIVSSSFAREHFGGASPIGRCLLAPLGDGCVQVVGVAGDARLGELTDAAPSFVYQPIDQRPAMMPSPNVLHVRTSGDPEQLAATVRRQLVAMGEATASVEVRAISELVAPQMAPWRASAMLLGVFAALGLLLAAVGLYGVVAFLVARRTREIGIRIALGSTRHRVIGLVLGDTGRLVGAGAVLGLLIAAGTTRLFRSMLFGVATLDPLVYAATAALLVLIALLAALSPARRATRVDPMVALRAD